MAEFEPKSKVVVVEEDCESFIPTEPREGGEFEDDFTFVDVPKVQSVGLRNFVSRAKREHKDEHNEVGL